MRRPGLDAGPNPADLSIGTSPPADNADVGAASQKGKGLPPGYNAARHPLSVRVRSLPIPAGPSAAAGADGPRRELQRG